MCVCVCVYIYVCIYTETSIKITMSNITFEPLLVPKEIRAKGKQMR